MELKEMLAPEVREALERAAEAPVVVLVDEEATPTTEINGVLVDLRGDAMHETACADCTRPLKVEIAPKGVDRDLLASRPRVAVCAECAEARLEGKRGTVVHKPKQAKAGKKFAKKAKAWARENGVVPKGAAWQAIKDGERDVEVLKALNAQDGKAVDLGQYSAPELATMVGEATERMRAEVAEALPAKVSEAIAERAEADLADEERAKVARAEKVGAVLPDFTHKGVYVPTLDLTEVTDMDTIVSAKQRSPYNKVLYREGLPIMHGGTTDDVASGANLATYTEVARVHLMMAARAGAIVEEQAVEGSAVLADAEPSAKAKRKAKVKALMQVRPDLTKKEAKALLASL